ncbi:MAG: hypothetical protein RQ715_05520 [Methylococcales bacterium]|nr:hypothetical protein [Methylococcales bacterium]
MKTLTLCLLLTLGLFAATVSAGLTPVRLSLEQAVASVNGKRANKILGARTETQNNRDVHVIKILTQEGRVQEIRIDAETGKPLPAF